jgi:hypothetical protein
VLSVLCAYLEAREDRPLVKKRRTAGNSRVPESARVEAPPSVEVSPNGDAMSTSSVGSAERDAQLQAGVEAMNRRYSGVFERLADDSRPVDEILGYDEDGLPGKS